MAQFSKSTLVMALKLPNIYYLINGARKTLRMAKWNWKSPEMEENEKVLR